jgi:hypothetical protein
MSASDIAKRMAELEREERVASTKRRRLQDRIDFVRSGGAAASNGGDERLRRLQEEERELSERRRELHTAIDALRIQLREETGRHETVTPDR